MMKTKKGNGVTNHTSVVYDENDTELSWSIESRVNYDKNKIGQRCV